SSRDGTFTPVSHPFAARVLGVFNDSLTRRTGPHRRPPPAHPDPVIVGCGSVVHGVEQPCAHVVAGQGGAASLSLTPRLRPNDACPVAVRARQASRRGRRVATCPVGGWERRGRGRRRRSPLRRARW